MVLDGEAALEGPLDGLGPGGEAGGFAEAGEVDNLENLEALAVLTQVSLVILVLVIGYQLEKRHVFWLSEAAVGLVVGIAVGAFTFLATRSNDSPYKAWMGFDPEFFFFVLLPPIIFDAGYSLDPKYFFGNFDAICLLAFFGTFVSAVVISSFVWLMGRVGACYGLTFLQAGLFGSLISATDPVTTLAILGNVNADQNLYYLIFGESVLNDAVAIVMYHTLNTFQHEDGFSLKSVGKALGTFLLIFLGSCFVGGGIGLLSSLFFRFMDFKGSSHYNIVEACLLVPISIAAYMAAEGAQLSGIVSILFCGIVMARYTRRNLSVRTSDLSLSLFKILAKVSEVFVFIYMGSSLFLAESTLTEWSTWTLFVLAFLAMLVARVCNVFPSCFLTNLIRPGPKKISPRHQAFLWFSGLRGAIAFALALKSKQDVGDEAGQVIFSTTLLIVLVTVFAFGGATPSLLSRLGVLATDRRRELDYHHLHSNTGSMSADDNRSQGIELTPTKYPESTLDDRPPPSYDEVQDDPISPFKQLLRSASGKVSLEEIDKQIEKVFVSPARNSEDQ
mmetsp:Transcript_9693/g.24830  ORF Transcript_9693/g.24830 Transcript_9693/m.24830 type:complete len:560 (+) Transcript_9693:143-1822(+)